MSILAIKADERVQRVDCTEDKIKVDFMDGRTITVPLIWYPRLLAATPEQREKWQISGGGYGIHWEEIDEDLSAEGLLRSAPAPASQFQQNMSDDFPEPISPQTETWNQSVQNLSISEFARPWKGNLVSKDLIGETHRLQQEAYDACHQRWRTNFIIFIAVIGLGFVFALCFQTLNDPTLSPSEQKWATVFLSSIVTGSIGFLTGKLNK